MDNPEVLKNFVEALAEAPIPIVYPMHPRTRKRLKQTKLYAKIKKSDKIQILPPVGYLDFLVLMKKCKIIFTDSGGIQEEATSPQIRKPVLVLRLSTERPEAVEAGFAKVVSTEKQGILRAMEEALENPKELPMKSPYGDGDAAGKIFRIIKDKSPLTVYFRKCRLSSYLLPFAFPLLVRLFSPQFSVSGQPYPLP